MGQPKYRRRKYYVNPQLQGRIIRRLGAYWCVYHVMLWHAMFLYRYLQYRDAVIGGAPPVPMLDLYLGFAVQNATLIICASLVFPLFLWDVFMLSHRIAGPLVRFQKTLRQLSDGEEVSRVVLRKGDLLFDLRDSFNDYLDSLEGERNAQQLAADASKSNGEGDADEEYSTIMHDLRDIGTMVRNVKTDDSAAGQELEAYAKKTGQA